jgi:hypothetical protein
MVVNAGASCARDRLHLRPQSDAREAATPTKRALTVEAGRWFQPSTAHSLLSF